VIKRETQARSKPKPESLDPDLIPLGGNPPCRAKDLVSKLLVVDPAQRLSAQAALEHPWLHPDLNPSQRPLRLTQDNFKQRMPRRQFKVGNAHCGVAVRTCFYCAYDNMYMYIYIYHMFIVYIIIYRYIAYFTIDRLIKYTCIFYIHIILIYIHFFLRFYLHRFLQQSIQHRHFASSDCPAYIWSGLIDVVSSFIW
jgi:serine/threonine protein kinase